MNTARHHSTETWGDQWHQSDVSHSQSSYGEAGTETAAGAVGDYNTAESGYDHYVWEASGHDEYVYWGPNQGPVKSNSHNSRWYEKEQVDSSSSYTERGVFGPGGDQGKYASNESYTDRWDYSGSGGSSGSYEDLITSSSFKDSDSYSGWDRYHYVTSDVGSFTEDGDAGYYSSEETWDGEGTRNETRETSYSTTVPETTYVIGSGYSITTPGSTSGNRGSFRVRTESDYVATAVYHERYDEPGGTWASSYHYDAVENVDRPASSPCHGESSTWYTGPLGDRSSSFTSDLTDHKHDEWHETELKEGWSLVVDGERTDGELGSRTTRSEVHSGNLQSHCEETVTANGYTTTTPTDTDHEWSNAPPTVTTTTGTAPTDEPTDPNLEYTGPDDAHFDALLAALDADAEALAEQAATSTLTPASRAALVDAAIQSFTQLDAGENGENGGAVYAEAKEPPAGTEISPTGSPSRDQMEERAPPRRNPERDGRPRARPGEPWCYDRSNSPGPGWKWVGPQLNEDAHWEPPHKTPVRPDTHERAAPRALPVNEFAVLREYLAKVSSSLDSSPDDIVVKLIVKALEMKGGDVRAALGLIQQFRDRGDKEILPSVDRFLQAWDFRATIPQTGLNWLDGSLAGISATLFNDGYSLGKWWDYSRINWLRRDDPNRPPTPGSTRQWQWGLKGAEACFFPTHIEIGSPQWFEFLEWLENIKNNYLF